MEERIKKLNQTTVGWINYFSIAKAKSVISEIDGWIRARLRMCIWKQWKKPKTKTKNLLSLKASKEKAYEWGNTRKGYWRTAHSPILSTTMTNKYLESIKFQSLSARYLKMQLT
jgi:RNA-directed DNA polymerase